MTDKNASIRIIDGEVEAVVKIGTFPRVGDPIRDKNGAYVYSVPEGIKVLSVDRKTGVSSYEPVTGFTHELDCETAKVSYGGKEIIVSTNESLAVFDQKTGELVRVKPEDAGNRLTPILLSSTSRFGKFGDRDLGWLFGAYVSDGWSSDRMIGYTKVEKAKRDEFVRILRKNHENFNLYEYAGRKREGKLGESVKIHCNGRSVADWMHQWKFLHEDVLSSGGNRSALYKMIDPDLIEGGSEEFLWGLMSGLLDGDGTVGINRALKNPRFFFRFNTSSPYLRDDFCRLCHRLGLRYSTTVVKARGWSKQSYVISPSVVDMFRHADRLSCIGSAESEVVEAFKSASCPVDSLDMVPVSEVEYEFLAKCHGFNKGGSAYTTLRRTMHEGAMRCCRSNLSVFVDELSKHPECASLVARIGSTDTKWVRVSSVEPAGKREVFDLEVPTTKTFVANDGIVVWDTVNIHVPASDKAAKQALEKMLPSKNLFSLTDMRSVRYKPEKEQISGLWALTRGRTKKPVRFFDNKADAIAAYRNGEIGPNDPIAIKET